MVYTSPEMSLSSSPSSTRSRSSSPPSSPSSSVSSVDPETQNELNYLAWKNEHAQRRRLLQTQFNIWRAHQSDRMNNHHLYKSESVEQSEELKQELHRRLSNACSCEPCRRNSQQLCRS